MSVKALLARIPMHVRELIYRMSPAPVIGYTGLMRNWRRAIALIVLTVCLPIQSWAAVAQPFCGMQVQSSAVDHQTMHAGHDGAMDHSAHKMPGSQKPPSDHDCERCGVCQLGCSSALVSVAFNVAQLPPLAPTVAGNNHHLDFLRKPLLRPPLA